jgi:hypothetical protein
MKVYAYQWMLVYSCLTATLGQNAFAAEPTGALLTPARFTALHDLIKPKPQEERWAEIPWLTSLWEARQRAAAEGKPILLWEMDGHPLGCT